MSYASGGRSASCRCRSGTPSPRRGRTVTSSGLRTSSAPLWWVRRAGRCTSAPRISPAIQRGRSSSTTAWRRRWERAHRWRHLPTSSNSRARSSANIRRRGHA